MQDIIKIIGAKQHNLKNIDLTIPKDKLVVFSGLSGSGKSSLAFDTIYAEGQRRYVESLSSYARQFLGVMDKPDVDSIEGLSPAISIDQKSTSHNPRSTVGTITEIYDYLRLLYARVGHPHCPNCGLEISRQSAGQIVDKTLVLVQEMAVKNTSKSARFLILSPVVRDRKGEFLELLNNLRAKGYSRLRIDKRFFGVNEDIGLIKTNKHTIEVVIDSIVFERKNLKIRELVDKLKTRLSDSIEQAVRLSEGLVIITQVLDGAFQMPQKPQKTADHLYSERFSCPVCNISIEEIEPRLFSFNSPHGACPVCSGIGTLLKVDPKLVINPHLTISEGGILPFARMILSDTWFGRILSSVAKEIGIKADRPISEAKDMQLQMLLYGTGDKSYYVKGENRFGREVIIEEKFAGVVKELERRYQESESEFVKHEISKYLRIEICQQCQGKRLKNEALSVTILDKSIVEVTSYSIDKSWEWINTLLPKFNNREKTIANLIVKEILARLSFLLSVGLDYLSLDRGATSLSGGEAQRIRLASQIGSGLSGVLYVLDEPSIGLHPKDNHKLIATLKKLRDLGNTVIVVEHDREMIENADYIYDFGPGAGEHGGHIIASGTLEELKKNPASVTAPYLTGKKQIRCSSQLSLRERAAEELVLSGCSENNLKDITVSFPLDKLIVVTGVSGSGKSTLVVDTLYGALNNYLNPLSRQKAGSFKALSGHTDLKRVILIDQSPIGRTPRSNPATYTGCYTFIRDIFAATVEAKIRGYGPGRFSFNVKGGRCEVCEGEGQTRIQMQFMPDVYVTCDVCAGSRFNSETLEVKFKDKNVAQILQMTVEEARDFFVNIPGLYTKLDTLYNVGLTYIHLGQPAPHLSGGEAQRVKLATELSKKSTTNTVFILDEPTTGLHFADLEKLLYVLKGLVSMGNTVVVIEHNLDIIKNADWIIDLGPFGGEKGGNIIATGTPDQVARDTSSFTGQYLAKNSQRV